MHLDWVDGVRGQLIVLDAIEQIFTQLQQTDRQTNRQTNVMHRISNKTLCVKPKSTNYFYNYDFKHVTLRRNSTSIHYSSSYQCCFNRRARTHARTMRSLIHEFQFLFDTFVSETWLQCSLEISRLWGTLSNAQVTWLSRVRKLTRSKQSTITHCPPTHTLPIGPRFSATFSVLGLYYCIFSIPAVLLYPKHAAGPRQQQSNGQQSTTCVLTTVHHSSLLCRSFRQTINKIARVTWRAGQWLLVTAATLDPTGH